MGPSVAVCVLAPVLCSGGLLFVAGTSAAPALAGTRWGWAAAVVVSTLSASRLLT